MPLHSSNLIPGNAAAALAIDGLVRHGVKESDISVTWVPGAYEIPFIAKKVAEKGNVDAVIVLRGQPRRAVGLD